MSIQILDENHYDFICNAFSAAKESIKVISPFVQPNAAKLLSNAAKTKGRDCTLITRFYREDFIRSVSSLQAIEDLVQSGVKVIAVKNLHTKLYLFDDNIAIVGSANFTNGGLINNIELSLALEKESDTIERLNDYFNKLLVAIETEGDFIVTEDILAEERQIVQRSIKGRDENSQPNKVQYGADIKILQDNIADAIDPVEQVLSFAQGGSTAVLKFQGRAHDRYDPQEKYGPNHSKVKNIFFTSSPFYPKSLTPDKQLFIAAVSRDAVGSETPIIVGRAKTYGADPQNVIDEAMKTEISWIADFPYYIQIYDIEVVDTQIINCISLNELIREVGYRLYPSTIENPSISIESLRNRHHRKSYIHITPQAAERLNDMLDGLFHKYGARRYANS